jgi:hypothetical protein
MQTRIGLGDARSHSSRPVLAPVIDNEYLESGIILGEHARKTVRKAAGFVPGGYHHAHGRPRHISVSSGPRIRGLLLKECTATLRTELRQEEAGPDPA